MKEQSDKKFSTKFGFLMAAVGSAVGLGNIWRFPYVAGQQGGSIFVIAYIVAVIVIGFSLMLAELALGRSAEQDILTAYEKKRKFYKIIGYLGMFSSFTIVSYYCVIGGWILKYIFGYMAGGGFVSGSNYNEVFNDFIVSPFEPILYLAVFVVLCLIILMLGVKKGIENINKILMPTLLVLMVFITIVSLTMPNAIEGVKFFLIPNFERIQANGGIFSTIATAVGQAFFSLSIGIGILATYGAYVPKNEHLPKNTMIICILDTVVALLAGFAILPAVFSAGLEVTSGSGLLFITLPAVFKQLGNFGIAIGFFFFLFVLFASVTSAISLMEVTISTLNNKTKLNRKKSVAIVTLGVFLLGVLVSLSQSDLFSGFNLLDFLDGVNTILILPLCGLFSCLYIGYAWSAKAALDEITNGMQLKFSYAPVWKICIKYICPVLISFVLIIGIVGFFVKI